MFDLNKEICIQCGECARVCPFTCITMENGYPVMPLKKQKHCVKCLHCAAICPTQALTFPGMPCMEIRHEGDASTIQKDMKNLIITRRSIRNFKKEIIPMATIENMIRTTDFAPSAKNQHPQRWIVVHNPDMSVKVMNLVVEWVQNKHISMEIISQLEVGKNIVTMNAPHLIYGIAPKEGTFNGYADTIIAMRDLELMMHSEGIGSCWAGYLGRITDASLEIRALLGIQEGEKVHGALAFGYPDKEIYRRLPYKEKSPIIWK